VDYQQLAAEAIDRDRLALSYIRAVRNQDEDAMGVILESLRFTDVQGFIWSLAWLCSEFMSDDDLNFYFAALIEDEATGKTAQMAREQEEGFA
jgi:hypothetical protein